MKIFIERNKGDYIYHDWEDESLKEMSLKFKELQDLGYKCVNADMDYMNMYSYYKNDKGEKITVTLLCS